MRSPLLFRLIAFLASFLLFQIELMAAKAMPPNFGGSFMVWGVSVTCFQGAVLTADPAAPRRLRDLGFAGREGDPRLKKIKPWTDDYSNLLSALAP